MPPLAHAHCSLGAHGAHPSLQAGLPSSAFIGLHTSLPPLTSQSSFALRRFLTTYFSRHCTFKGTHHLQRSGYPRPSATAVTCHTCCAPSDVTHLVFSDVYRMFACIARLAPLRHSSLHCFARDHRAPQSTAGPLPPSRPRRALHLTACPRKAQGSRLSDQRPAAWGASARPGVVVSDQHSVMPSSCLATPRWHRTSDSWHQHSLRRSVRCSGLSRPHGTSAQTPTGWRCLSGCQGCSDAQA